MSTANFPTPEASQTVAGGRALRHPRKAPVNTSTPAGVAEHFPAPPPQPFQRLFALPLNPPFPLSRFPAFRFLPFAPLQILKSQISNAPPRPPLPLLSAVLSANFPTPEASQTVAGGRAPRHPRKAPNQHHPPRRRWQSFPPFPLLSAVAFFVSHSFEVGGGSEGGFPLSRFPLSAFRPLSNPEISNLQCPTPPPFPLLSAVASA